jgi:hypothetical protein
MFLRMYCASHGSVAAHDLKAKDLLFSDLTPKDLEFSTNVVRNTPKIAETDSNEPFFGLDSGAVLP